jgi:hypothetical protein
MRAAGKVHAQKLAGAKVDCNLHEWIYDLGPTQFVRVLSFDATTDRLLGIFAPGDYGS